MAVVKDFVWKETTPGVWQRDADEVEEFYSALIRSYAGSGRMEFAITGHVSLTVPVTDESASTTAARLDEAVRSAWLWLRHDNPTIASRAYFDQALGRWQKRYEELSDETARAAWGSQTLQKVSNGQTGIEWANSDPPAPKVATLFVVEPLSADSPSVDSESVIRRDLVLRSPHDIIDGIGTLQLFSNLIAHISRVFVGGAAHASLPLLDGSETARLSPPYRAAADVPETPTPAQQARLDAMQNAQDSSVADNSAVDIGIPFRQRATVPGKHKRVSRTISPVRTAQLLAALKPRKTTVTHAFHAAIATVVRDIHFEQSSETERAAEKKVRYTNYILRNERAQCLPPYNTPKHAAAVYHSVSGGRLEITLSSSVAASRDAQIEEFANVLASMREYYLSVRDDKDHYALAPYIMAGLTPDVPGSEDVVVPVPAPNPRPSVSLSSMGVVDGIIVPDRQGGIRVDNPWVTGEELGNGLGLFLGTFRGELCLSAAYNEAWHGREEVEGFLERCERVVFAWVESVSL